MEKFPGNIYHKKVHHLIQRCLLHFNWMRFIFESFFHVGYDFTLYNKYQTHLIFLYPKEKNNHDVFIITNLVKGHKP